MSTSQFPGTEMVDPRKVFSGPGYNAPKRVTSGVALLALSVLLTSPILTLILWTMFEWAPVVLLAPAAVVLLARIARTDAARPGKGGAAIAQFAWVMGWTSLTVVSTLLLILYLDVRVAFP